MEIKFWIPAERVRKQELQKARHLQSQDYHHLPLQPDTHRDFCMFRVHIGRGCGSYPQLLSVPACCQSWVQLAVMQLTYYRCQTGTQSTVCCFTKAQQPKGGFNPNLLKWIQPKNLFSCTTLVCGMVIMAENDNHFDAPVVTKAHWKKPNRVSSFTADTCWMGNVTQ